MKTLLWIWLLFSSCSVAASLEHLSINEHDFSLVTEEYDLYDSKGKVLKLYREEPNRNLTFLKSLTLSDVTGGCSGKSIEEGTYEINGSVITLYTQWLRRGKAHEEPEGARIQHFEILQDGTLRQNYSELYIETARKSHAGNGGLQYLFTQAKSDEELEKLQEYVAYVEQKYKATFVFDQQRDTLTRQVQEALKRKTKAQWRKDIK